MKVAKEQHGKVVVLRPQGPFVGTDADQFSKQVEKALQGGSQEIVLDASEIPLVDSRGLEVLVEVAEQLIRAGQALKIMKANPVVWEVLELTELASLFEPLSDLGTAAGSRG